MIAPRSVTGFAGPLGAAGRGPPGGPPGGGGGPAGGPPGGGGGPPGTPGAPGAAGPTPLAFIAETSLFIAFNLDSKLDNF